MTKENNGGDFSERIQRCYCQKYSCEARPVKQEKINENDPDVYTTSDTERFRYIKNEGGAICGGGKVPGCIENCRVTMDKEGIAYSDKVFKPRPVEKPIQNKPETKKNKKSKHKNN